jgi:hypothetical protein
LVKQKKSREDENSPIVGRRGKKVKKMNGKKFGVRRKRKKPFSSDRMQSHHPGGPG